MSQLVPVPVPRSPERAYWAIRQGLPEVFETRWLVALCLGTAALTGVLCVPGIGVPLSVAVLFLGALGYGELIRQCGIDYWDFDDWKQPGAAPDAGVRGASVRPGCGRAALAQPASLGECAAVQDVRTAPGPPRRGSLAAGDVLDLRTKRSGTARFAPGRKLAVAVSAGDLPRLDDRAARRGGRRGGRDPVHGMAGGLSGSSSSSSFRAPSTTPHCTRSSRSVTTPGLTSRTRGSTTFISAGSIRVTPSSPHFPPRSRPRPPSC